MKFMKSIINKFLGTKKTAQKAQEKISDYWIQKMDVKRIQEREEVFKPYLENRKVLHVGCTDYPIFDPNNNLHLTISKYVKELHGMDLDQKGLDLLNGYFEGVYFNDLKKTYTETYDTILIPETIEHVDNIKEFMQEVDKVNADTYIITGPNAFHSYFDNAFDKETGIFTEAIHPDHNCWFSPYTLKNAIQKYSNLKVNEIYLCSHDLMVVCICSK